MSEQRLSGGNGSPAIGIPDGTMPADHAPWPSGNFADALPMMIWSAGADGRCDYVNSRWHDFTGLKPGSDHALPCEPVLHPDDRERTDRAWAHSVATGEPFEAEYRLRRADGHYRWILARATRRGAGDGGEERWFGTCTDIHDHKVSLDERQLLDQELAHRIKNIFAVISGLIGLSARTAGEMQPFAESLRDRVLALGRAHDFVRPHNRMPPRTCGEDEGLHGLLREIFAPYEDQPGGRVTISGPNVSVDDRSATPLALGFHEIVTNAAKYGALSSANGHVALLVEQGDHDACVTWRERGGPPIRVKPVAGFGSRLLDLTIRRQLGGRYEEVWEAEGLTLRLHIPLSAFSR